MIARDDRNKGRGGVICEDVSFLLFTSNNKHWTEEMYKH